MGSTNEKEAQQKVLRAIAALSKKRGTGRPGLAEAAKDTRIVLVIAGTQGQYRGWLEMTGIDPRLTKYVDNIRDLFGASDVHYRGYVLAGTWYTHSLFRSESGNALLRVLERRGVHRLSATPGIDEL